MLWILRDTYNHAAMVPNRSQLAHFERCALSEGMGSRILIKIAGDKKLIKWVLRYSGESCSFYPEFGIISKERTKGGLNKRASSCAPLIQHTFGFSELNKVASGIWGFKHPSLYLVGAFIISNFF